MIKIINKTMGFILFLIILSCSEECAEDFDFILITKTEQENWFESKSLYNLDMTPENCTKFNIASDEYISALHEVEDCVAIEDKDQFNTVLNFIEDEKIDSCN